MARVRPGSVWGRFVVWRWQDQGEVMLVTDREAEQHGELHRGRLMGLELGSWDTAPGAPVDSDPRKEAVCVTRCVLQWGEASAPGGGEQVPMCRTRVLATGARRPSRPDHRRAVLQCAH